MTTYTPEIRFKLEQYLGSHELPRGMGTEESACSIAAINLALSGKLTDDIPDCMSKVIGGATIILQDAMPDEMRNSERYKRWLPDAAGTGCDREAERLAVFIAWMWDTVLPQLQTLADEKGFGEAWQKMCAQKTAAARAADAAAYAACDARAAVYAAYAARAADAAADAARAADSAGVDFWDSVDPIGILERMTYLEKNQ